MPKKQLRPKLPWANIVFMQEVPPTNFTKYKIEKEEVLCRFYFILQHNICYQLGFNGHPLGFTSLQGREY